MKRIAAISLVVLALSPGAAGVRTRLRYGSATREVALRIGQAYTLFRRGTFLGPDR